MQTLEPILAKHPFFKGLEPQYLQLITGCASNVRFGVGEESWGGQTSLTPSSPGVILCRPGPLQMHFIRGAHGMVD